MIADGTLDVIQSQHRGVELPITLPTSRRYLPEMCRALGFTRGAEIGVWQGTFSAMFCEANPELHMLCVDPWVSHAEWLETKKEMAPGAAVALMAHSYEVACQRLAPLNATIIRKFSADAAKDVQDGSLDFVYIDGNHVYDAALQDLEVWAPKVRSGGLVAGHDYRVFPNKPTVHVVEAVNAYTTVHAIDPWFLLAGDKSPSFLWVVA